ncbi:hypothetical protein NM208_g12558 [Fusarium decemcellulare]|uniref:Uncharacterized protein n=1 Tax=Fusarium decemcellulare TaxID=57161 RepID=A0ACC1RN57_9HYPO|nr:hypothetical protein NM208_g12558 [Fusarium decemcellulare]
MIQNLGLIWTLRILSLVTFIVNITFTVLIKDRYKTLAPRQLAFDTSLFRRIEYILVLAFGAFSMLGYFVLIFTLANYANEIGLDASQAAIVSSMFSLGQTVGRPVLGHLGDSLGRINMATLMTLLAGILSLTIWVNAKTYGVLLLFSLLGGIPAGTFWISASPILADVIGLENLPSGLSILWLVLVLPSTFSSPVALQIFSKTGSYIGAQLFTGLAFIAAGVCMGLLRGWAITRAKSLMSSSAVQADSQTESQGPSNNRLGHVNIRSTVTNSVKWANV